MAEQLGKYEVRGILGKGAMGTVYDARDPIIDRRVAIKTLTLPDANDTETQEELARFKREAQAAGRLTHPNIVGVFDYGETDTIAYIVMEFVDGPSLKGLLDKQERFSTAETVRVMEGLLAGLQFSHERGVVHRDIKPANVMLTKDGQVKIADFGIARIESSSMTQAGTIMGTPAYMSPEQFMGQTVDARTDIYSSGVVLYQMLTGERPFEGSMTAIMHKALNTSPPKPSELSVTAPSALDDVVARAMAKRPEQRYANAAEFASALRAAFEGNAPAPAASQVIDTEATLVSTPRQAAAASPPPPPARSVPKATPTEGDSDKSKMPLIAAAVVGVLVVGGGAGLFLMGGDSKPPAQQTAIVTPTPSLPTPVALPPPPTQLPASPPPPSTQLPAPAVAPVVAPPPAPVVQLPVVQTPVVPPAVAPAPAPVATAPPTPVLPPAPAPSVAPPPPPPQQTAVVVPNLPAMRQALSSALAAANCAQATGDLSDANNIVISGVTGRTSESALRRIVAANAPSANIIWRATTFDGPYCNALDTIRPYAVRFGSAGPDLDVGLKSGSRKLRDSDNIIPRINLPDFPAYLMITYFSNDGTLAHLHPSESERQLDLQTADGRTQHLKVTMQEAGRSYPARSVLTIGDPDTCRCKPDEVGFQSGPPFGMDMIMVVATSQPLFNAPRPADETPDSYLRDLQIALDQAQRRGLRISARSMIVETTER